MRNVGVASFERNGTVYVEFRFKAVEQLLDPSDPSPLPNRELTEFAEEYIVDHLNEYRLQNLGGLIISLPEGRISPEMSVQLPDAISRHFMFRSTDIEHEIRLSLREGKISLAIAIPNAVIAVLFVGIFANSLESLIVILMGGLITILNWVTIWDTYEYFVYDYRHLVRKRRIYRKIPALEIRIAGRQSVDNPVRPVSR